jgi:hypothetical protein
VPKIPIIRRKGKGEPTGKGQAGFLQDTIETLKASPAHVNDPTAIVSLFLTSHDAT